MKPAVLLPTIKSPTDLKRLSEAEVEQLAQEIRDELCQPLLARSAHFASNLGVVELCLALHLTFDFRSDRLIWDTGHQIYPHKLVTGRYEQFRSIRTKDGLMGYPNPAESPFDLFMTGHAGSSASTALGLKVGDTLQDRANAKSIAVIGDGAFPSGIVFEAMNNATELGENFAIILNDNKMSICPRVGGVAKTMDRLRMAPGLKDLKRHIDDWMPKVPLLGGPAEKSWQRLKDIVKAGMFGGMLFEELGFSYYGPIDGHDIPTLRRYLQMVKEHRGPVLLHVLTQKGHGVEAACQDPVTYHAPPKFEKIDAAGIRLKQSSSEAFTDSVSSAIYRAMERDEKVCVITAAMCQGNKLQKIRDMFPARFFDTGICESHAVAFAAGLAKTGLRPIVDIYSTFLQRSFDQIFQEVSLQNLPVTFCLDRAGFTGPDGPTHHGTFDIAYMRMFPNMVVMAPADELDVEPMLSFALKHSAPTSIRYPKAAPTAVQRKLQPIELGRAETLHVGNDGCIVAIGAMLQQSAKAVALLRDKGFDIGLVNARFIKPMDEEMLARAFQTPVVLTVEEGCAQGGFGSAVLETCNQARIPCQQLRRLAIPDRYILHAEREEQLAEAGLDVETIVETMLAELLAAGVKPTMSRKAIATV